VAGTIIPKAPSSDTGKLFQNPVFGRQPPQRLSFPYDAASE